MSVTDIIDVMNGAQSTCYDCSNADLVREDPPPEAPPQVGEVLKCQGCGVIVDAQ